MELSDKLIEYFANDFSDITDWARKRRKERKN